MLESVLTPPANASVLGLPGWFLSTLIPVIGVAIFTYIMAKRIAPLVLAAPDNRFDRPLDRVFALIKLWLGQWKQPRYMLAGVLHIMIFGGFIILSLRSTSLVIIGISEDFVLPGFSGVLGHVYNFFKDYAATMVFIACVIAAVRRGIYKPARYAVPEKYGHDHTSEAVFVLGLIATLMLSESYFEASAVAANVQKGLPAEFLAPLSLAWFLKVILNGASVGFLQPTHVLAYYIHDLTFFFFLCFLPQGKHFHVITSIFNVWFMKLNKGSVKPVKWGVTDEELDDLESFGVKKFEDFTWKHVLDFYSCADCGRCSDQCPANAVGRPLSPRFISIKARDYAFKHFPLQGDFLKRDALIGDIYDEDEIWSCTTCGACEEECPLTIEYIDKIVDLRRGMVDEGLVPQSLQKPLSALEKRGNPWGKMEKKRADWAKDKEFAASCEVKVLDKKTSADTLFFLDSITSYDDRIQLIAQATARVLDAAGVDFGVLGKAERDSGHEVRRFGEEMLFQDLKDRNTSAILKSGVKNIVTADPHAYNALIKDYQGLPPVEHISQVIARGVTEGKIRLRAAEDKEAIYTYHDPCYLGRHNGIYDIPRDVLDAIPGIKRVEMLKSRDRSFCCGGGGLMLFYEPIEEKRMGQLRVEMAKEAGATVIVTACPFCMVNMEDAIKTSGLEGEMEAIDLVELIDRHLIIA
ncbi:MAG: electron transfer flavoprotein [Desulfobacteraceae bacterium 4572_88]|nr:MAG: electron transfer flavoprotein [Desulfobacteraceae bacterium 4572_88]